MTKKREKIKIKLTELNNKSRKGTYIYIKEQNKKGAYFKYKEGQIIDPFKQYYVDRYIKNKPKGSVQKYVDTYRKRIGKERIPVTPLSRQADRYLKKIRKLPTIQQAISRGITNTVIKNALKTTRSETERAKKNLLRNLVLDKDLLNVLVKTENIQKIKTRLEYRIQLQNANGEKIAETVTFNKTPEQVIQELKKGIIIGEGISKGETPKVSNKLQNMGYQKLNIYRNGNIDKIKIHIIFRKGR